MKKSKSAGKSAGRALALRRLLPASLLVFLSIFFASNAAFAGATLSEEQGYGRLVFNWPSGVPAHKESITAGVLVLEFDKAPNVDMVAFTRDMPRYVALAREENGGKILRIALKAGFTLNTVKAENSLYVDLLPPDWQGAPPSLPADVQQRLAAAQEVQKAAAEEEKAAIAAGVSDPKSVRPELKIRIGRHDGFSRLVFDWSDPVLYKVVRKENQATITFDRTAKVMLGAIKADLPPYLKDIKATEYKGKLALILTLKPDVVVTDFREDSGVVLDLKPVEKKPDEAPLAAAETAPTDITPKAAQADDHRTIESEEAKALAAEEAAKAAPVATAEAGAPADVKSAEAQVAETADAKPADAAQTDAAAAAPGAHAADEATQDLRPAIVDPTVLAVGGSVIDGRIELRFPWTKPVGSAIFERNGKLWIVFDETLPLNFSSFDDETRAALTGITPVPLEGGTAIILPLPMGSSVTAYEEGTVWSVSVVPPGRGKPLLQGRTLALSRSWNDAGQGIVALDMKRGRKVLSIVDPNMHDTLMVATARSPLQSIATDRAFTEFLALRSVQGVAIQPIAKDLSVTLTDDDLEISRAQGLALSANSDGAPSVVTSLSDSSVSDESSPAAMDFDGWRKQGGLDFTDARKKHEMRIATTVPAMREKERLDYVRFLLAYQLGPEALAVLKLVAQENPAILTKKSYLALHAVGSIQSGQFSSAIGDLSVNDFAGDPYAMMWRGIAFARLSQWERARADFTVGESAVDAFDDDTRAMARVIMAQAALDGGDIPTAAEQASKLPDEIHERRWNEEAALIRGRIAEGNQQWDDAEKLYNIAIAGNYPPVAARARFQLAVMNEAKGKITEDQLVDQLDRLRFAWRGDDFEVQLLKKLSDLRIKRHEIPEALSAMQTASRNFPNSDVAHDMGSRASDIFAEYYINGGVDKLPAVQALAVYYNFQDLTPIGQKGDEMVRHLADRLASVDLLPQAEELLQHQVDQRLHSGYAKAQVAAKLAGLYLMDRKPQKALDALRSTRQDGLPADIDLRRRLIEAHALAALKQFDLALEILDDITDPKALVAKADVLWDAQRWPEAGKALESLAKASATPNAPLDEDTRFQVMRGAIAYSLASDEEGLTRLRTRFGPQMAQSEDASSFAAISDAIESQGAAFRDVASRIAQVNTLDKFMAEMRKEERASDASASSSTANTPAL